MAAGAGDSSLHDARSGLTSTHCLKQKIVLLVFKYNGVDGAELDPEKGVHNSPRTFLLGFAQYIIADKSLFVDAVRQQKDK